MVRGVRVEARRAHKAGFTAATAADTLLGVQADAKTQWQSGKPTTLHIRRLVMVMLLAGLTPTGIVRTLGTSCRV